MLGCLVTQVVQLFPKKQKMHLPLKYKLPNSHSHPSCAFGQMLYFFPTKCLQKYICLASLQQKQQSQLYHRTCVVVFSSSHLLQPILFQRCLFICIEVTEKLNVSMALACKICRAYFAKLLL